MEVAVHPGRKKDGIDEHHGGEGSELASRRKQPVEHFVPKSGKGLGELSYREGRVNPFRDIFFQASIAQDFFLVTHDRSSAARDTKLNGKGWCKGRGEEYVNYLDFVLIHK